MIIARADVHVSDLCIGASGIESYELQFFFFFLISMNIITQLGRKLRQENKKNKTSIFQTIK